MKMVQENGMNLCMLLLYANANVFVRSFFKTVGLITDATVSRPRCYLWNVFLFQNDFVFENIPSCL